MKKLIIAAALITSTAAWAQDYEPAYDTTGHYESNAYGREYVPPSQLPNPYPGAYQPPIETTLQNQEFINQSYRK